MLNRQISFGDPTGPPKDYIGAWLDTIGMGVYKDVFTREGYDRLESVEHLTEEDLDAINVKKGHIKVILKNLPSSSFFNPYAQGSTTGLHPNMSSAGAGAAGFGGMSASPFYSGSGGFKAAIPKLAKKPSNQSKSHENNDVTSTSDGDTQKKAGRGRPKKTEEEKQKAKEALIERDENGKEKEKEPAKKRGRPKKGEERERPVSKMVKRQKSLVAKPINIGTPAPFSAQLGFGYRPSMAMAVPLGMGMGMGMGMPIAMSMDGFTSHPHAHMHTPITPLIHHQMQQKALSGNIISKNGSEAGIATAGLKPTLSMVDRMIDPNSNTSASVLAEEEHSNRQADTPSKSSKKNGKNFKDTANNNNNNNISINDIDIRETTNSTDSLNNNINNNNNPNNMNVSRSQLQSGSVLGFASRLPMSTPMATNGMYPRVQWNIPGQPTLYGPIGPMGGAQFNVGPSPIPSGVCSNLSRRESLKVEKSLMKEAKAAEKEAKRIAQETAKMNKKLEKDEALKAKKAEEEAERLKKLEQKEKDRLEKEKLFEIQKMLKQRELEVKELSKIKIEAIKQKEKEKKRKN